MAIRQIRREDGSVEIEADSVQEFVEFQRLSSSSNGTKAAQGAANRASAGDGKSHSATIPEAARKLVRLLYDSPADISVSTADLAKSLGFKEAKAVGGSVTSLTSWGKHNQLTKRQMIVRGRNRMSADGKTIRTMALTETFRKMLKEGKVAGMKLDT